MYKLAVFILVLLTPLPLAAQQQELTPAPLPEKGETLRDFLFYDYSRNLNKLYEHRGKPVILFFWSPADTNSLALLEELTKKAEHTALKETVVYVIDISGNTGDALMQIASNEYPFTFLDGDFTYIVETYGVTGVPTVFVVDKLSRLVKVFMGFDESTTDKIFIALKDIESS